MFDTSTGTSILFIFSLFSNFQTEVLKFEKSKNYIYNIIVRLREKKELKCAGIADAVLDARLLLEYVCHTNRNDLLVHGERPVDEIAFFAYEKYVEI